MHETRNTLVDLPCGSARKYSAAVLNLQQKWPLMDVTSADQEHAGAIRYPALENVRVRNNR